jgi:hypothetical protein
MVALNPRRRPAILREAAIGDASKKGELRGAAVA